MAANTADDDRYEEQLFLHGADHPGTHLVPFSLTYSNFRLWKNAAITALRSKDKLGMVDDNCLLPAADSKYFRKWHKVNSMVVLWIKASISPDLVQQFAYINDVADLWNEIQERYGVSNLAMLFQIKKEMSNFRQDNMGITEYYGKMKELTDQLGQLRPMVDTEEVVRSLGEKKSTDFLSGARASAIAMAQRYAEISSEDRVVEFLLGLNEAFGVERSKILLM